VTHTAGAVTGRSGLSATEPGRPAPAGVKLASLSRALAPSLPLAVCQLMAAGQGTVTVFKVAKSVRITVMIILMVTVTLSRFRPGVAVARSAALRPLRRTVTVLTQ
jgi:hypothetical protein